MSVRELIVASAGSGKTFRISSRIIELLASGAQPRSIFASTFTRKAAGEILDRVLLRIGRGAADDAAAASLAAELDAGVIGAAGTEEGAGPDSAAFWREVLEGTLRELHRLDIGTLDAFFGRALGSFAFEVGLPPGWGVADEPTLERTRAEALDGVLGTPDRAALVQVLRALHAGDVRRSVHAALARDADALMRVDESLVPEAPAAEAPGWQAMRRGVEPRPADLDAQCAQLAVRIRAVPVPEKKSGGPDSRWLKAMTQAAERVEQGDWEEYLKSGLYPKVGEADAGEEPLYYKTPFPEGLADLLDAGAALARLDLGEELAARAEAMGRLAGRYREAWQAGLLATGRLRFDDVTRLLAAGGPLGRERAELMYRFDGSTEHVLLDEYQDTSLLQWEALRPAVEEVAAGGRAGSAAVVVADPKQSIYGWRGAAPVVVDAVRELWKLPVKPLAQSWRSSQRVLDVVNAVFTDVYAADVIQQDAVDASVAETWGRDFSEHEEAPGSAGFPKPGYVALEVGPEKRGRKSAHPEMCRHAAARVAELVAAHPGRSVGVLTRTNTTVARLMHELGELGVAASEEGGSVITDSAAVVSVLALLRMVDHPGHGLARYHAGRTAVGPAVGFDHAIGLDRDADLAAAIGVAHDLRRRLLQDGYGSTLRDLYSRVAAHCDGRDHVRMGQLVELGYAWDAQGASLRTDDFVQLARATRAESPGEEPVRVMTIHGSKGLEFDIVVLPELHGSLFGRGDANPVAYRPEAYGRATHAFPPVRSSLAALFDDVPRLREALQQTRAGVVRDGLSGLYVAMTRARYALHMLVPADGAKASTARSPARLLREQLVEGGMETPAEEGAALFELGDANWHTQAAPPQPAAPAPSTTTSPITLRTATRSRMLERVTPSSEEGESGDGGVNLRRRLGVEGGEGRAYGSFVHAVLEEVVWLIDDDPAASLPVQERIEALASREAPELPADQVRALRARLVEQLSVPALRAALTAPDAGAAAGSAATDVRVEVPFLMRDGEHLVEGVIDRLVLHRAPDGTIERAEIIDWKTDALPADDPAALNDKVGDYVPQLHRYARAVERLYGVSPDRITARLAFLSVGQVCEVPLG